MKLNTKRLSDIVIGTPLLAEGVYIGKIDPATVEVVPNKNKDGNVLKFQVVIQDEVVRGYQDGKEYDNRGKILRVFENISLTEKNGYDPNVRLKELGLSLGLPVDDEGFELETDHLKDHFDLEFALKHKPAAKGYDACNQVGKYLS